MSKINSEYLKKALNEMITARKERKFLETVELQIGLRDYDPERDKRFSGSIRLPFIPHPFLKVAVIGTAAHCEDAKKANERLKDRLREKVAAESKKKSLNETQQKELLAKLEKQDCIECIDVEGLKKFNKEKKLIKKWAKPYDVLLASESLMKQIPRLLGNVLVKIGKFPLTLGESEQVEGKVSEIKQIVKFQLKKVLCLGTAIGTVEMEPEQIRQNLNMSINFLVSLLKKGWQNVKSLHVKTTMGKPFKIFG